MMNGQVFSLIRRGMILSLGILPLAACSSEDGNKNMVSEQANAAASGAEQFGTLKTAQGTYRFTPASCILQEADGAYHVEIKGPGKSPTGEKLYFELASTGNEMLIQLGVDEPYQAPKRRLLAGQSATEAFTFEVQDNSVTIPKLVIKTGRGERIDDNASLQVNCTA